MLDGRVPPGPIEQKWDKCRFDMKLVSPANRRKHTILIVGSGLAGCGRGGHARRAGLPGALLLVSRQPAPGSLDRRPGRDQRRQELPQRRRQHFPPLLRHDQGGRLPRPRGKRLPAGADQRRHHRPVRRPGRAVRPRIRRAARDPLVRRRSGRAHVLRPRPDRPAVASGRLPGARATDRRRQRDHAHARPKCSTSSSSTARPAASSPATFAPARSASYAGDAVVLATGGYGNVFYLSTNAKACNTTAIWRAHRRGAYFGNPCFTQIHPTCIPVTGDHQSKLTLMSESLRNDGRVWVPKKKGDSRAAQRHPRRRARLFSRAPLSELRQPGAARRGLACRQGSLRRGPRSRARADTASISTSLDAIKRQGVDTIKEKYGNLFEIYERITGENAYEVPMRIYPAVHYTMGGLWVDYQLMSNLPGLFVAGEANFSDQGANRLGASALMQGLADGYFILPATVPNYLASTPASKGRHLAPGVRARSRPRSRRASSACLKTKGQRTVDSIHRELGKLMWDNCGMSRSEASLRHALAKIPELREEFRTQRPGAGDAAKS